MDTHGHILSTDQWLCNLIKHYEHKQDPICFYLSANDTFLDPVDKSNPVIDSILPNGRYIVPDMVDTSTSTSTNDPIHGNIVDTNANAPIHGNLVDTNAINYEQDISGIESSSDDTHKSPTKNLKVMDMLNNRQQKLINKLLCKSINPYVDYRSVHPYIKHGIYSYFKVHKYSSMKEITRMLNISHYALYQILQIFDLTWDRNKRCVVMT